jgi:hypothetical protein
MSVRVDQVLRLHNFTLGIRIVGCINHPAGRNATGRHG